MTDNDIIKALKECLTEPCSEQAYINAVRNALSLINRQKAEYEDLQEQFRHLDIECERLEKANESQKAEIESLNETLDNLIW